MLKNYQYTNVAALYGVSLPPPPLPEFRTSDYYGNLQDTYTAAMASGYPEVRIIENYGSFQTLTLYPDAGNKIIHLDSPDLRTISSVRIAYNSLNPWTGNLTLSLVLENIVLTNISADYDSTNPYPYYLGLPSLNVSSPSSFNIPTVSLSNTGETDYSPLVNSATFTRINTNNFYYNGSKANDGVNGDGGYYIGADGIAGADGDPYGSFNGQNGTDGESVSVSATSSGSSGADGTGGGGNLTLINCTIDSLFLHASYGGVGGAGGSATAYGGAGGNGGFPYDDGVTAANGGSGGNAGNASAFASSGGNGGSGSFAGCNLTMVGGSILSAHLLAKGGAGGSGGTAAAINGPAGLGRAGVNGGSSGSNGTQSTPFAIQGTAGSNGVTASNYILSLTGGATIGTIA